MKKIILALISAALSLAIIGCATGHGTSPKGLELPIEQATLKFAADVKDGGYKVITTNELKKMIEDKKPVLILSSLPAEEDKAFGKIPSAINGAMPKTEKEITQADKDNLLKAAGSDKNSTIVTYCGFVACRRSHHAAKILVENGFKNVYRYPAGITGWSEAKYPLIK